MKKQILILALFIILQNVASATTVQQRLNQGESPKQIFDSGINADSLYGKAYQGGLIFYLDTIYGNGLVSSEINQSNGTSWGCYNSIIGTTSDSIGSGLNNTLAIVSVCTTAGIAARICNNLQINNYNDWFLPSKNELLLMYNVLKLNNYGGFSNMTYWSSTENSSSDAWYVSFNNSYPNTGGKNNLSSVRAIRAFAGPAILKITPAICIVGVDSATNENRIIWERNSNPLIDSVKIYKETIAAGQYAPIGIMPYNQAGIFIDTASNPMVQSYRYKISLIDTNNFESFPSNFHKTIHLTINAGLGGVWNLIWSNYEGFSFGSYRIYRGSDSLNLQLLTQIQSNLTSYTDINPPIGNVYYQIEIVSPHPCYPDSIHSKVNTNYNSSRSNTANTSMAPNIGFSTILAKDISMKIYPNPNNGQFTLELNNFSNSSQDYNLEIYSAMGMLIHNEKLKGQSKYYKKMNLQHLSKGVYFVRLKSKDSVVVQKFVVN